MIYFEFIVSQKILQQVKCIILIILFRDLLSSSHSLLVFATELSVEVKDMFSCYEESSDPKSHSSQREMSQSNDFAFPHSLTSFPISRSVFLSFNQIKISH